MDFRTTRAYEIELWDASGNRVADISALAESRSISFKRNAAETLQFSMDLDKFSGLCLQMGDHPRSILWPNVTEVKVKRNGEYWFGTQVVSVTPYLNITGSTISVRCLGYLSLFDHRRTSKQYINVESTGIAGDLVMDTQAQTNGDFGITLGAQQFATGISRTRTDYQRKKVKDALTELTQLEDGRFDFRFTHDKKFETYQMIGSVRTDVKFVYGENIKTVNVPTEGKTVANKIYGLGSGFGADQLTSTQSDASSQLAYMVREDVAQFNSVSEQATLDQNTLGYLGRIKDMLQIPRLTVTGKELDLGLTSIGDRIPVDLTAYKYTDNIDGLYRIEQMDIELDDNDFEEVTLSFDDEGLV